MRQRPGSHRANRSALEDVGISWVLAALREEGHDVTDVWDPETDLKRRPELDRRPDCAFLLDGAPAAIEDTMFVGAEEAEAGVLARRIREVIEAALKADPGWRAMSILATVVVEPGELVARKRSAAEVDALEIAERLDRAAKAGEVTSLQLEVQGLPSWVRAFGLTATTRPPRPFRDVYVRPPWPDVASRVDAFLAHRLERKGHQLDGWGLGILAVMHGWGRETADDLRAGLARLDAHPWWRVYWVAAEPPPELAS